MNGRGLNLFKPRTKLGEWLDAVSRTQEWLMSAGLSRNTVSAVCNNLDYEPNEVTQLKIISFIRKNGYNMKISDFW